MREQAKNLKTPQEAKLLFKKASKKFFPHNCLSEIYLGKDYYFLYRRWLHLARTIEDILDMYRTIKGFPREIKYEVSEKLKKMITTKIDKARTIKTIKEALKDTNFDYSWSYERKGLVKWNQLTINAATKAKTVKQAVKVFKESTYEHRYSQSLHAEVLGYEVAAKKIVDLFITEVIQVKRISKIERLFIQAKELPLPCSHYRPIPDVINQWLTLAKTKEQIRDIYMALANYYGGHYYNDLQDQVLVRLAEFYKNQ